MGKQLKFSRLAMLLALAPVTVLAAPQPDSGTLMDTVKGSAQPAPSKVAPPLDIQQEVRPAFKAPAGFKVKVQGFHITGTTAYTEAALLPLIQHYVGRDVDMVDLDQAAAEISKYYRQHGYFVARAYLPAQEIKNGKIEITMLEGKLGSVVVKVYGASPRLSQQGAQATVASSAKVGAIVQDKTMERGLLLLNDYPGVDVKSTLVPGATTGTSNLLVEAHEGRSVTGNVNADNFGNKYTGTARAGGTLNINDPSGRGDLFSLSGMTSGSGMNYGRLSYMSPAGSEGLKLGAAYSAMDYKLNGIFSALNAKGSADVASIYALYPFTRSRNFNLYGNAGFDAKTLKDQASGSTTNDKKINVLNIGVSGDSRDAFGAGGINAFALTLATGNLSGSLSEDSIVPSNALSRGSYEKLNYSATTLRRVNDRTSVFLSLAGQLASKNLDSSEKFILGGSSGVRAYPQGEAAGDEGMLMNIEARYDVPASISGFQLVGFFDAGRVTLHQTNYSTASYPATNPNSYTLAGAGFGVSFVKPGDYMIHLTNAWKVGNNPGRDASGNDSDGSNHSSRLWLQGVKWF